MADLLCLSCCFTVASDVRDRPQPSVDCCDSLATWGAFRSVPPSSKQKSANVLQIHKACCFENAVSHRLSHIFGCGLQNQVRSVKRGSWFNPEVLTNQKVRTACMSMMFSSHSRSTQAQLVNDDAYRRFSWCLQREWGKEFKDKKKVVEWPGHCFESFVIVVSTVVLL